MRPWLLSLRDGKEWDCILMYIYNWEKRQSQKGFKGGTEQQLSDTALYTYTCVSGKRAWSEAVNRIKMVRKVRGQFWWVYFNRRQPDKTLPSKNQNKLYEGSQLSTSPPSLYTPKSTHSFLCIKPDTTLRWIKTHRLYAPQEVRLKIF